MFLRITLLFVLLGGSAARKLLYIQVLTKDLKSNRVFECIWMTPREDESIGIMLQEAAREEEAKKTSTSWIKKLISSKKEPKKAFTCRGKTVNPLEPQWICKKTSKLVNGNIRTVLCALDIRGVYVIKREVAEDFEIYGFCLDPDKFYVFHFQPDTEECDSAGKGLAQGANLQMALIVQPYIPKGCVSSYLRYLEEKDWGITASLDREESVEKMNRCFFKTLKSTIDYKLTLQAKATEILHPKSVFMQKARERGTIFEVQNTVTDPFISKDDVNTLHESMATTFLNYVSIPDKLKNYKHRLKLEPRIVDKVDAVYTRAVLKAREESESKYSAPIRLLLKIDAPSKLTQRQILRIFLISQTKYRRLLVAMLVLMDQIHDTCEYMGNPLISKSNALALPETLNGQCTTACQFVSEFAKILVYWKSGNVIMPVCLGSTSGFCVKKECTCTILSDVVGRAGGTSTLKMCVNDVLMINKSLRFNTKKRQQTMKEKMERRKQYMYA